MSYTDRNQKFDAKVEVKTSLVDPKHLVAKVKSDFPEQLVCGFVEKPNSDEHIVPTLIASFRDLASLPVDGVIYFGRDKEGPALRKLFLENSDLIGVSPLVLKGYPDVFVDPVFDQAVWNLPEISYAELVAEVVAVRRVDNLMNAQAGARQKPAKRENALVRERKTHFNDFDTSADDGDVVENGVEVES